VNDTRSTSESKGTKAPPRKDIARLLTLGRLPEAQLRLEFRLTSAGTLGRRCLQIRGRVPMKASGLPHHRISSLLFLRRRRKQLNTGPRGTGDSPPPGAQTTSAESRNTKCELHQVGWGASTSVATRPRQVSKVGPKSRN
jgi:hypothetical protein